LVVRAIETVADPAVTLNAIFGFFATKVTVTPTDQSIGPKAIVVFFTASAIDTLAVAAPSNVPTSDRLRSDKARNDLGVW
jgi:hypothetical protein